MKPIKNETRKELIDVIKNGILDNDKVVKIFPNGRLKEIEFLSRLYELDKMPSKDPLKRFLNAIGDIEQHTVLNDDWGEYWYFYDERFNLSTSNDATYLLNFICEMLHPAVREENSEWEKFLEIFNKILEQDGYKLTTVKNLSGYEVFEAREIDSITITHSIDEIHATMALLGEGSYARVYKYIDKFYNNKEFALKRAKKNLKEEDIIRFRREFDEMKKLKSPYIIEVYSFYEQKNEYTMEFADYNLEKYIKANNSNMNLVSRRSIIMQLLAAFNYLHSKNILHRDICPKNILLKKYDDVLIVKLSDFGLIKLEDSTLTADDTDYKGSYNDPSLRIEGFKNYDLLHEIYSITLVCAYVLTGKDINNLTAIKNSSIRDFIEKGTSADKTKRFHTLDELKQEVISCLNSMQKSSQKEEN